jgi:alpha,alpha-trehalose phosphorylase
MDSPVCGTMMGHYRSGHVVRPKRTLRGQLLEIEVGLDKVEYALREGECLVIRHETEEIQLTREHPVAVRPISRR